MRAVLRVALAIGVLVPIVATAQPSFEVVRIDYNMQEVARPPALPSARAAAGRKLFVQYCSLCHDPVGHAIQVTYGPLLDKALLKAIGDQSAREIILKGTARMPGFQYLFKGNQVDAILAFVRTYSPPPSPPATAVSATQMGPHASISPMSTVTGDAALKGRITASTGGALAGVTVSARAYGKTVTTTVFTDEAGNFIFPALQDGRYAVWTQAVGYATARAKMTLSSARPAQLSLQMIKLIRSDDIVPQLSGAEWFDSLPAETEQDKRLKEMFRLSCAECHQPNVVLQRKFDESGWRAIIQLMQQAGYYGWNGPTPAGTDYEASSDVGVMQRRAAELARYLARIRGPESAPLSFKLLPRPAGKAAQVVITGYDIPPAETPHELSWQDGGDWSEGAATGMHSAVGVHDVVVDSKGNAWLTESVHNNTRTIIKVDAPTGRVTSFYVPPPAPGITWGEVATHGMGRDSKGHLWFALTWRDAVGLPGGELAKIDPETEAFYLFPAPPQLRNVFAVVTVDSDAKDKIWIDAVSGVISFDPEKSTFSYWHNLTRDLDTFTYGVTGDSAGNGWWTVPASDRVEMTDPNSGETHEFTMRPPWLQKLATADVDEPLGMYKRDAQFPRRIGADKNGPKVWVPNFYGQNLAEIDVPSRTVTYHKMPINTHPYFAKVDKHHVVWINLMPDDRVASFDPSSQQWTVYRLPVNGCESRNITVDDRTGDVWVPCFRASKVFRLHFKTGDPSVARN